MTFGANEDPHKISIQLQFGLKINLVSKIEHFKYIGCIKILL